MKPMKDLWLRLAGGMRKGDCCKVFHRVLQRGLQVEWGERWRKNGEKIPAGCEKLLVPITLLCDPLCHCNMVLTYAFFLVYLIIVSFICSIFKCCLYILKMVSICMWFYNGGIFLMGHDYEITYIHILIWNFSMCFYIFTVYAESECTWEYWTNCEYSDNGLLANLCPYGSSFTTRGKSFI